MGSPEGSNILDGKAVAETIHKEIRQEIDYIFENYGRVPGLAVVIVGERKDSQTYVRRKVKACVEVGIKSTLVELPGDVSEEVLLDRVLDLNQNREVHGILVQLPLPKHVNEERILQAISVEKDVDGLHPLNIGKLCMKGREPLFIPCTPKGCIELLDRMKIPIAGKKAVVVGRSNIVGLPVAMLLNKHNATVTVVHALSPEPRKIVKEADIVIAAAGQPEMVRGDWIKEGAIVIDVGINTVADSSKKGYRLVGDVKFEEAKKKARLITPVPGGVGPITVAMLLKNTLEGAKRAFARPADE